MVKMTTEVDIIKQAIEEYNTANKLRKINQITYEHMLDAIRWVIQYCEKNKLPLPRSQLLSILDSSHRLMDDNNEVVSNVKKYGDCVIQKLEQIKPKIESSVSETPNLNTKKNFDKTPTDDQNLPSKHLLFENGKFC